MDVNRLPIESAASSASSASRPNGTKTRACGCGISWTCTGRLRRLVIFGPEDNLVDGPVPYGAPTHREMVNQNTPIDYRPMAWDLNSLYRWLSERMKKKRVAAPPFS